MPGSPPQTRHILFYLLPLLLAGSLIQTPALAQTAQWTFMVYLDADNNLESAGVNDFLEMASVGSTSDVNIVVLFDRISGYDTSYDNWTDTRRGRINPADQPDKNWGQSIGEQNMGNPQTLIDFAEWTMLNYPASNYALILWNHGDGWRADDESDESDKSPLLKSICADDTNADRLYLKEVRSALQTIQTDIQRINLIGFDACLMAMTEVAYEIRQHAQVMVASEDTEPGDGWPYDSILADLSAQPTMTPNTLAENIVTKYYQSYGNSQTQSALDLTQMDNLALQIDTFAQTLINNWDANIINCVPPAQAVMAAIDQAVIIERHGDSWPASHGLAIYFPQENYLFDSDYNISVILFPGDTQWEEFLMEFYDFMTSSWLAGAREQTQQYDIPEHIDLYDFCENLVAGVPDDLDVNPSENAAFTALTPGQFPIRYKTYTLTNTGPSTLYWNTFQSQPWLSADPTDGSIPAGQSTTVDVYLNQNANSLPPGLYEDNIAFRNIDTQILSLRKISVKIAQPNYFTEFLAAPDLDNLTLTLIPDASPDGYHACTSQTTQFPTDPSGGTTINLSDDDFQQISPASPVPFYGTNYSSVYINSNGNLTFLQGDETWQISLGAHFNQPRLAGLFTDMNPADGGTISYRQFPDRLAITFQNIPEYNIPNQNSFQMELFFAGPIRITWLDIQAESAIAGLSQGNDTPPDFTDSDLSNYHLLGDLQCDCKVTLLDLAALTQNWLDSDCGICDAADLSGNSNVDLEDLLLFLSNWLINTHFPAP